MDHNEFVVLFALFIIIVNISRHTFKDQREEKKVERAHRSSSFLHLPNPEFSTRDL
jgi:hypothetical protein